MRSIKEPMMNKEFHKEWVAWYPNEFKRFGIKFTDELSSKKWKKTHYKMILPQGLRYIIKPWSYGIDHFIIDGRNSNVFNISESFVDKRVARTTYVLGKYYKHRKQ